MNASLQRMSISAVHDFHNYSLQRFVLIAAHIVVELEIMGLFCKRAL